ncbi:MAG TPA: lantibiotic dehydratase [Pyrinomonadaceae bacterium]|jgi:thiopeptide-type bacteriocin biosynthesis protein
MNVAERRETLHAAGFFVLRTPLLSFDEFLVWGEDLEAAQAAADEEDFERAYAADCARLRERLRAALARPEVRDALFVTAPNLIERFHLWADAPDSKRGRKLEHVLVRYFARMTARPTPFGLFAGISTGTNARATALTLPPRARYERHTRLDMEYLAELTDALARAPALRSLQRFWPNSSLYVAAGRVRYVEARTAPDGTGRSYHLVAVERTPYLERTLARALAGASADDLAAALVDEEVTHAEAAEYVGALIENQVLVSDLAPPVTGPEPLEPLVAQLRAHAATRPYAAALAATHEALAELDAHGPGAAPDSYRALAHNLSTLVAAARRESPADGAAFETAASETATFKAAASDGAAGVSAEIVVASSETEADDAAALNPAMLFQVELLKPAPGLTLGAPVLAELVRAAELLHRLTPRRDGQAELQRFVERFTRRYQEREVALVEALDEESGVGFAGASAAGEATPLLRTLALPDDPEPKAYWGARERLLLRKLSDALTRGATCIELGPRDLEELAEPSPLPLPDAFSIICVLSAASADALQRGDVTMLLEALTGPSGAHLLGRFCHADAVLRAHVAAHLRAEEARRPEAVFAEIAHLPGKRIGNVICRPSLREYEIVYLGRSGAARERQLPVSDLLVSVRAGRVRLRSARLGREVIPRLTNAHNYGRDTLGLYRFLCVLQTQGVAVAPGWHWGALRHAPYLPRVVAGRIVLALATWLVPAAELRALARGAGAAARFRAVQRWRAERRLPRLVRLTDSDHQLTVDLDNALSVESFVQLVKGRTAATLTECFPAPDALCVRGPEGRFTHELVVPCERRDEGEGRDEGGGMRDELEGRRQEPEARRLEPGRETGTHLFIPTPVSCLLPSVQLQPSSLRPHPFIFPPGSEWLYAKLYTGAATADRVLCDVVRPLVEELTAAGATGRWFFVRYADPEWHLRVRFQGVPARLHADVLPALQAACARALADGRVWRVQLDTYEREVERYGGAEGIELAERIFHADSEAALEIVELLEPGDEGADERWRLALCGMDRLLSDLGFDLAAKCALVKQTRDDFAREFRADKGLFEQLRARHRQERRALEALLAARAEDEHTLAPGLEVLGRRSARLAPVVGELRACAQTGRLARSLSDLAQSFMHMHANRLLRSAQRAQELVIYDLLTRHYESQLARAR